MGTAATKIVYLDQKCWIDIAKLYYGRASEDGKKLVERIFETSEKGQTIFPLSISHLDETLHIASSKHRMQLASLMTRLSKGYALQPYVDVVIQAEIENMVLRKVGLHVLDIRSFVLRKGISHLVGAKPEVKIKDSSMDPKLVHEIEEKLLHALEDPKTIELIMKSSPLKELDQSLEKSITEMERIRRELRKIKDNKRRWRAFLAKNICDFIVPKLAEISVEYNLPEHFFIREKPTRRDASEFLDNIPTALCFFTLIFRRDQQFQRLINKNDFNDIWFLTLAIPYCNIVVTEKMWASISRQAKLDKKCNTIILSSINELGKYI
jgi:hypothetical protein